MGNLLTPALSSTSVWRRGRTTGWFSFMSEPQAPVFLALLMFSAAAARGADGGAGGDAAAAGTTPPMAAVLPAAEWRKVENGVDRALAWLAARQAADGSFPTLPQGQPAVTSLAIMAFLSRGHQPGAGPYGQQINRAIDYVIACQMPDSLFSYQTPAPVYQMRRASHTASYNHGISGLMLAEVYGQVAGARAKAVRQAIEKALQFTRELQIRPKTAEDRGGWRYLRVNGSPDSDLSVTAWQLMFLRSARNSEFNVPQQYVEEAMAFVRRCWDERAGGFRYAAAGMGEDGIGRGVTAAGIVSLAMAGQHQTKMAQAAGDWLLAHPFRRYGEYLGGHEKFIYSTLYWSQAAAQLGGRYWQQMYPPMVDLILKAQTPDGSWRSEANLAEFGDELTTAMAVLSLTPPYQLLPVYQR